MEQATKQKILGYLTLASGIATLGYGLGRDRTAALNRIRNERQSANDRYIPVTDEEAIAKLGQHDIMFGGIGSAAVLGGLLLLRPHSEGAVGALALGSIEGNDGR